MRIAIDIRTAANGEKTGKGWYTFHITKNLLALDKKNQYILYSKTPPIGFENYPNAEIRLIKGRGFLWQLRAARDIKQLSPDIFFAPTSYITPTLLPKNIKTVLTVHDLVAFLFPNNHNKKAVFIEKSFLKKALKSAAHITSVSESTKKDIIDRFQTPAAKISVIPCAADKTFHPVPKEDLKDFAKKTNLPAKFFLAIGTLEPRKNHINLIKAFKLFHDQHPDYHLIIVGKKGWQYDQIFAEIKASYLKKNIHTLGYLSISSIKNLYNLTAALVFPSFYEGFGMPPLEALQSGCPVITSDISSLPEVVGDSALLVDPHNPQDIADAMGKIATDPEFSKKLSHAGPIRAKQFSWEKSAKLLLETFKKC